MTVKAKTVDTLHELYFYHVKALTYYVHHRESIDPSVRAAWRAEANDRLIELEEVTTKLRQIYDN